MHYDLCPVTESDSDEAWSDNSECEDCALIAAAYDDGYAQAWEDAGEDAMLTIQTAMRETADRIYESLLMAEPPYERFGSFLQEFR